VAKKIRIDASDVSKEIRKSGGRVHVPEGEYLVKIHNHEVNKTKNESGKYIRWECIITKPEKYKGKTLRGITSLKKDALWSLRNLIHAAKGTNIAGKVVDFDPETIYGKVVGAAVSDNVYTDKNDNERISSQIDSFFPKDEVNLVGEEAEDEDDDEEEEDEEEDDDEEEEEEEEEKPKKKKKAKKSKKDEDDDDEDEELEDVDVEDI
jgi:hypothetical protein